jgi:ubiquinone/menaquinone biosynthesis C-methylase UbiE
MKKPQILRYYLTGKEDTNKIDYEIDSNLKRPAWIHVKTPSFDSRFITLRTETESEILYKRFTGNFYYPIDLVIRPEDEKVFYAKYAQFYDQNTAKNNLPMAKFLLNRMAKLKVSKKAKILDLGAGTGIFSDEAFRLGYHNLTLVDISEAMLAQAKKKKRIKAAKFIVGDVTQIKLDDTYDVIVSVMMFDNVSDELLPNTLKRLSKHLKKDGTIFLIEDKERPAYKKTFNMIEGGVFHIFEKKDFAKYYFIGNNKNNSLWLL